MGTLQTNPPTIPNTEVDSWQPLVLRDAMSYYGLNKVSLTNWDETTTIPQIAQGSMIDIDGSLAYFSADESIIGAPADGAVYVYFLVSGSTVTPEFTNTAPEWYADKGGWYDATGNRYSGHVMTKAGTAYSNKLKMLDASGGEYITAGAVGNLSMETLNVNQGVAGSYSLAPNEDWIVPMGVYFFGTDSGLETGVSIVVTHPSSPLGFITTRIGGMLFSDGVNVSISNGSTADIVYYRKFL